MNDEQNSDDHVSLQIHHSAFSIHHFCHPSLTIPPVSRPTPLPPDEPMLEAPVGWTDPYDVTYRRRWAILALLLIFTAALFAPTLQSALIWGDDAAITENPAIHSLRAVAWTAAHPRTSETLYHPLADALLWLEYHRWLDWNPSGYHIISLALHLLNTMLFWLIL